MGIGRILCRLGLDREIGGILCRPCLNTTFHSVWTLRRKLLGMLMSC